MSEMLCALEGKAASCMQVSSAAKVVLYPVFLRSQSRSAVFFGPGYLLLGCDGVWERFTNQQVVDFLLPRPPDPGRSAWDWAEELPSHPVLGSDPRLPAGRLSVACSAFLDRAPPSESRVHLCSDPKPLLAPILV